MIDTRPLVIAYHNSEDVFEKELIQKLTDDLALNKDNPIIYYESGDAAKHLSPASLEALKAVVSFVQTHRQFLDLAMNETKDQGWALVCALPAKNDPLAALTPRNKRVTVADKGKEKMKEISTPENPRSSKRGRMSDEEAVEVEGKGKEPLVREEEQMSDSDDSSLQILEISICSGGGGSPLIVISSDEDDSP